MRARRLHSRIMEDPFAMENPVKWDSMLQSPLFGALHPVLARLAAQMAGRAAAFPGLDDLNALLDACDPLPAVRNGAPVRFVAQPAGRQPFENQYEPRCYLKGEVQTRARNWHDLFNALVWLAFPRAKAVINAGHYAALQVDTGEGRRRGRARDALTLLDESGVIVACASPELEVLLREFQWKELFWQQRDRLQANMRFFIFGHGLYEKALSPYVGMTGQGLILAVEAGFFAMTAAEQLALLDDKLAAWLEAHGGAFASRDLTPVPLLGVPGWSNRSADPSFYNETGYFRPRRLLFRS